MIESIENITDGHYKIYLGVFNELSDESCSTLSKNLFTYKGKFIDSSIASMWHWSHYRYIPLSIVNTGQR